MVFSKICKYVGVVENNFPKYYISILESQYTFRESVGRCGTGVLFVITSNRFCLMSSAPENPYSARYKPVASRDGIVHTLCQ